MRFLIAFILVTLPIYAEDLYVAQTAAGADNGTSCANAKSMAWFNTAGSWGGGAGEIDPGDTVHFCGTITTTAVIQLSGTAGNPITLVFEPGAKFSKGTWNQSGSNGDAAIFGDDKSYITVRGKRSLADLDIESTSNGTGLTTENQSVGVWFQSSDNIIVENMAITNMYRRTPDSLDNNQVGGCIQFRTDADDIIVRSNIVAQANVPLFLSGTDNLYVYGNIGSDAGEGVLVMGPPAATVMQTALVYDNRFSHNPTWAGQPEIHLNCIHIFAFGTGGSSNYIAGLRVYNNTFDGPMGTDMTSMLFLEGQIGAPKIYNNLFIPGSTTYGGNGYLTLKGAPNALVANNTWIGQGVGTAIGTTEYSETPGWDEGHVLTNNLIQNVTTQVADAAGSLEAADYNIYSPDSGSAFTGFRTFAQWKTFCGCDANSKVAVVDLDVNYIPIPGDTEARLFGRNLTPQGITTDHNGVARPGAPTLWTAGAFQNQAAINWNATVMNAVTINVGQ